MSSVGLADDVALMSNNMTNLSILLHLTKLYCLKYNVKLVSSKTKLLVYYPKDYLPNVLFDLLMNPIEIDRVPISPSDCATHVGVVRSPGGNGPHIGSRLSAHRKAVFGLIGTGFGRHHYANPAISLRIEQIYGSQVLMSGLATIVLTSKEEKLLDQYYKVHLERLLRLHQSTPSCFVFLSAGRLTFSAQLHLKILSVFGQVCRFQNGSNVLTQFAHHIYSSTSPSVNSFFWKVRSICLQYSLPHPLSWLTTKPSKESVRTMGRASVLQYWLNKLRLEAAELSSLRYLRPNFLCLTKCHPILRYCSSSKWEVEKATITIRLLSGRYRLESLTRHFSPLSNRDGFCVLDRCWKTESEHKGDIESFLTSCESLAHTRNTLVDSIHKTLLSSYHRLLPLVQELLQSSPVQFFLDCSTLPQVIREVQLYGEESLRVLLKLTRNYCFSLHKTRQSIIQAKFDFDSQK